MVGGRMVASDFIRFDRPRLYIWWAGRGRFCFDVVRLPRARTRAGDGGVEEQRARRRREHDGRHPPHRRAESRRPRRARPDAGPVTIELPRPLLILQQYFFFESAVDRPTCGCDLLDGSLMHVVSYAALCHLRRSTATAVEGDPHTEAPERQDASSAAWRSFHATVLSCAVLHFAVGIQTGMRRGLAIGRLGRPDRRVACGDRREHAV